MKKLNMHTSDMSQDNIAKIREIFPSCVTEANDELTGRLCLSVDFDHLRQELSGHIVEESQERYRLDWPGKREASRLANAAIANTLRPCRDESIDFDKTENLFIEGDNLDVLKALQTSLLGQVKLIYIDPPYNTGNDFVYEDNFSESITEYLKKSGQVSSTGGRLVANTESNGRFHSDWLSMIYPRLKVARTLLSEDGAIFISIDEGEKANLKRICDELFGEENYRNTILTRRRVKSLNFQFAGEGLYSMNVGFEYVLIYAKSQKFRMNALRMQKKNAPSRGKWNVFWSGADRPTMRYELLGFTPTNGQWRWKKQKATDAVSNYEIYLREFKAKMSLEEYWRETGEKLKFVRRIDNGTGKNGGVQYWIPPSSTVLRSSNWTDIEVSQIKKDYDLPFENPKSVELLMELLRLIDSNNYTVLDFFAGSATTADAVLRLNSLDGGSRRFIMVQLDELIDKKSGSLKAGFKTISEVSRERIRRAGKNLGSNFHPDWNQDLGFRALYVDSSNMRDVYYRPAELNQSQLMGVVDNVKDDRTHEDLLFQVLIDLGLPLTLPIRREAVQSKIVFFVNDNDLIACFDRGVTENLAKDLASRTPLRVVFRDNSFDSDPVKVNVQQIFRQLSRSTDVRVI